LCNKPYSGTQVIKDYGKEHIESGSLIVYTSADSVFQIAAHEDIVGISELYRYCDIAREICRDDNGVGRVIARPFAGDYPNFVRTGNRHDFSLPVPKKSILDVLSISGFDTIAIGKIKDIFAGSGIKTHIAAKNNGSGMAAMDYVLGTDFNGLCFTNLVDFDMLYGHRNDVDGYASAISEFDDWLETFIPRLQNDDLLIITADHGCDPATSGTDHTREYIPLIIYKNNIECKNLGTRESFSDIGKSIADIFSLENELCGESFIPEIGGL
jgi:phosphopentomutase